MKNVECQDPECDFYWSIIRQEVAGEKGWEEESSLEGGVGLSAAGAAALMADNGVFGAPTIAIPGMGATGNEAAMQAMLPRADEGIPAPPPPKPKAKAKGKAAAKAKALAAASAAAATAGASGAPEGELAKADDDVVDPNPPPLQQAQNKMELLLKEASNARRTVTIIVNLGYDHQLTTDLANFADDMDEAYKILQGKVRNGENDLKNYGEIFEVIDSQISWCWERMEVANAIVRAAKKK